jgi:hypothetical protein
LSELFSFVEIDCRSFAYYFSKNKAKNDILDNMMIQRSHAFLDTAHPHELQNSLGDIDRRCTFIDGFYLQRIYSRILDKNEMQSNHMHVIFQDNLVCTHDENDKRYHARPIICGSPSIISIAGIVEGPAKPKGYYIKQMQKELLSINSKEIENEFADSYVSNEDPRLVPVAIGYAIQAVFFFLTNGNPFCSNYPCRLFNSHWQEELIYTQVIKPVLCKDHLGILAKAKEGISKD